MNRKGMEIGLLVRLLLWILVIGLVVFFLKVYVVDKGGSILEPATQIAPALFGMFVRKKKRL